MKTSCFKHYTGDMGVAICLYPPMNWAGMQFPALAPDRQTFYAIKHGSITQSEYERLYREQVLSKLDPQNIYDMFQNNVLLCWEEPWFDQNGNIRNEGHGFCHRHIVSAWLWENLHIEVPEWNNKDQKLEELSKKKNIKPLF